MQVDDFKNLSLPEKRRVLAMMQARAAGTDTAADRPAAVAQAPVRQNHPRLVRDAAPADSPFALTDLQTAYLVAKVNPVRVDPAGCHVYLEFDVDGIDPQRLERAWVQVAKAHPMLRAQVLPNGLQRIVSDRALPAFGVADHRDDAAAAQRCIERVRDELSHRLYLPGDWPLYEIRVTRLPEGAARIHVSMDSWIVDAHSAEQIYTQWQACYEQPDQAPASPDIRFRDFIHSMKAFRASDGHARSLAYWQRRLTDMPDGPALPWSDAIDKAPVNPRNRQREVARVSPAQWARLQALFAQRKLSATAGVLAVFCDVLRGWTTSERFGLVLTLQNRPPMHADIQRVVGPFTSSAMFAADCVDGETLGERARRYGEQLLEALDHGHVGAIEAWRSLGPDRPQRNDRVVFTSLLAAGGGPGEQAGWMQRVAFGAAQTPGTALHCQLRAVHAALEITFDAVPSWFEGDVVHRLLEAFQSTLQALADEPALWDRGAVARGRAAAPGAPAVATSVPMSLLQQGYLAERIRHPRQASGYIFRSFRCEAFQPARWQQALDALLADHPMLKAYASPRGTLECPDAVAAYEIPVSDASDVPAQTCAMLQDFVADRGWPAFRLRLLRQPDGSALLLSLLDMAAFDAHSAWSFYNELIGRAHGAAGTRESGGWKPFLLQRGAARGDAAHQRHWAARWADLPAGPRLAGAHPLPASVTDIHATTRWAHTWADIGPLDAWASAHGVSLEALLLAAYARALPNDRLPFALGVVDYGLRMAGGVPLAGFGDATRFAWVTASGDHATASLLALATDFDQELARDRQHAGAEPFHALRAHLASGQPAVVRSVVMTNCLDTPAPAFTGVTEVDAASDTPGVAIDNLVQRCAGGLTLSWIVRRDQVDLAEVRRCFDHYVESIQALIDTPSLAGAAGERVGADERARRRALMARWNATDVAYDRTVCLHTLFERRARAAPFGVAVLSDDEVLTYGELDARANRLANHLQALGVGRGTLVAMMLPRTNHLVVTALAIIKCGGAFIPLNIDDPQDRLARVLAQAQATTVVSTREHYGRFDDPGRRVVLLDAEAEQIAGRPSQFQPREAVLSDDRAYIIFTSGSTGTPKGVIVRHRPVVNLIEWAERTFNFNAADRVLFVNPLSFDLSIFDLFGMLAYGASIRIVSDADRTNALAVAGYLKDEPITFWNSAPAYLQMVLPFLEGGVNRARAQLERMRVVFLSGDWIPLAMPDAMKAVAPKAQVISLGGATEAAVWSNYFPVESLDPAWRSIPYGRPIQNARYYILDDQREPVAVGEAGDLFIGGECLSDGYINEPELTAQSFVNDPFHERAGAIMYRTGDRARFFADGNIEFLGRIDHQVKLRGYRIELGEVEAALEAAGLPRAVAVVRDDEAGRRLVGFAAASAAVPPGELADEARLALIRGRLPAYMVPAQVIVLPALPITPNGKVDRKRLTHERMAALAATTVVAEAAAPSTATAGPIDARLAEWLLHAVTEILGPEQTAVGLDDNLGQLGFSSLHYTMLGAKLANELGVAMNPALFFRYVSVAEIRDHLLREQAAALAAALAAAPAAPMAVVAAPAPAEGELSGALERWLRDAVNAVLGATETPVQLDDNLGQLGFNSLHYTSLAARLADELGMALNPALFFRYVSIAEIRDYLLREHASALASALRPAATHAAPSPAAPAVKPASGVPEAPTVPAGAIAIIGMSGVMPQAADLDAFWRNLLAGADNSSLIPADRWDWRSVDGDPNGPGNFTNVHRAAFMDDVAGFDAAFFSISPREAELMDPRQRLLLEGVWSCLEDAALRPGELRGESVGLFVGATGDEYATLSLQPGREIDRFTLSGVSRTILANRVSYLFDWHGPSEVVDTACSSSLVAVHNAVRALQHGDCKLAIAGGINVMIDPVPHVCLNKIGMLAADGRCKTFDARADGYARGEGIGLILLKPLADALRDGDPVHAVIRGSAVNHGGRATALSAPNPAAQVQVIQAAIRAAGVDSGRIGYLEAHGTGTALGDPIEIEALKEVFTLLQGERGQSRAEPGSVALSSVKPNVGHLESAAGIAGLLKAILCVKHGQLPATLHLEQLNPNIHLDGSPFFIVRERQDWPMPRGAQGGRGPRLAGVSSFGFGGVNAHIVVEQHVAPAANTFAPNADEAWWIPLSAQGVPELQALCHRLSDYLRGATVTLADVAITLQAGRASLQERALLRVNTLGELTDALTALAEGRQTPALHWRGSVKSAPMRGAARRAAGDPPAGGGDGVVERWQQHGDAAWPREAPGLAGRRVHLPTYPFEHTPYWLPALAVEVSSTLPALLPATVSDSVALAPTSTVLAAHTVAGRPVLPAAAYLALARRAIGASGEQLVTLADAVWMQPFSAAQTQALRIVPGTSRQGSQRLSFVSGAGDAQAEHCTVDVLAAGQAAIDAERVGVAAAMPHHATHDDCYAAFERGGVQLAAPYRSVQGLSFDPAGGVASLRIVAGDAESCWLLALDGALQAIALHHQLSRPDGAPSLPFHARRVHLQAHVGGAGVTELSVRLALQPAPVGNPARVAKYDADLLDASGRRVGRIESCAGKGLVTTPPAARAPKSLAAQAQAAHLYVPRWEPLNAARVESTVRGLLVTAGSSLATPAGWLRAERTISDHAAAARSLRIDARAEADWSAVLADDAAPELIVLDYTTWPAAGGSAAGREAVYAPFDEAFALARAAMKLRVRRPLSVVAVYGDQAGSMLMPAVQALGAFGRAVRNESPSVRFSALALAADPRRIDLAAIGATIAALPGDAQRAVNYRCTADGRLQAERLTKAATDPTPSAGPLAAGSVVVVSGGAGGIGRLMAGFLTARGCRVALLGRSDPASVAVALQAAGLADPRVCRYLQADVTQADQVRQALDQVRRDWGPVQAVFHAAGGRADGMLLRKDSQTARTVLAAKVAGAIVLDEATRDDPLEHFIAFSSLASYLGPVGQADYTYANAFLDGLVRARNELVRQGLRRGASCSVGWPLWREGGMRMSDAERDYIAQLHGMNDMATDTAMQCLLAILGGPHETVALAVGDSEKIDRSMLGRTAGDLIGAT
ncbi:amino acid adenylation domain-containing protein [Ideonella sp.]|uniref:amino acid adenylation domain-containing protein n=1 Tax=Ideonella sp. TaxID=1929293 RepID=UPI0035B3B96B